MNTTAMVPNMARYAARTMKPKNPAGSPFAMLLIMAQLWERGRRETACLKPEGICSVEKKVLQRKDMGVIIYEEIGRAHV